MAVFKCKMCGGTLEVNNETVAVCQYCGTKQTLPKLDDDRKANLYDRANHFRRNNEFDKAMGIYEQILNEDNTDAESYWSLVLCRYGIEYVEDPTTHKRIPTVNRAQFTSIFDDEDYKSALQYADGYQKEVYEQEATVINDIQKGILAISSQEEPFDVFICYKESDNNGRRTPDSVLATELYHELAREGFKVFFARITLEDKLGQEYEPYIFAALNSAKVMVALGTKPEYFNAVWVRNEWSRYLALIKNGARKMLIPAYKDMDPYDLPEEFSHLQAQDMSKLGFMQDLIRGIKKIVESNTEKRIVQETVVTNDALGANITALLERGYMALEDSEWEKADDFFEQVLNHDAKNAKAYLGKLMAELQVKTQEELKDQAKPFDDNINYQKTVRFANDKLKVELNGYVDKINKDAIYNEAKSYMQGNLSATYECAINLFMSISGWKDADEKLLICREKLEVFKKEEEKERIERERQAELERIKEEKRKKLIKKITIISAPIVCAVIAFIIVLNSVIIPNNKYNNAVTLMNEGKYTDALSVFESIVEHKESKNKINECKYNIAKSLMSEDKYSDAIKIFQKISNFKDSKEILNETSNLLKLKNANYICTEYVHTVGLKSDGTVVATKYTEYVSKYHNYGQYDVEDWTDIVAISAGQYHTVGLKSNGTVVATKSTDYDEYYGECDVKGWKDIVAISSGDCHTVGLKSDGTVVATGYNGNGQCDVKGWKDIVAISAGDLHTVGLKADGTVVATGDNEDGNCNVDDWTDIVAISADAYHTVGLKSDGTVVATEYIRDYYVGQCDVEDWTDIVAISAGQCHTVGLKSDGTVVATKYIGDSENYDGQCDVKGWKDIVAISAGDLHTVGLKADGTVVATKYIGDENSYCGQCDVKGWKDIKVPQSIKK